MYLRNSPDPAACPSLNGEGDQMFVLDESFFLPLEIPPTNAEAVRRRSRKTTWPRGGTDGRRDCLNGDGSVRPPPPHRSSVRPSGFVGRRRSSGQWPLTVLSPPSLSSLPSFLRSSSHPTFHRRRRRPRSTTEDRSDATCRSLVLACSRTGAEWRLKR